MYRLKSLVITCALLSYIGFSNAAVAFTKWPTVVYTGKPANVYWSGDPKSAAIITLRKGPADNLQTIKVLTTQAKGGQYTWTPDGSLPDATDYALEIDQTGNINYSGHITLAHEPGKEPVPAPAPTNKDPVPVGNNMRPTIVKGNSNSTNSSSSRGNATSTKSPTSSEKFTGNASFQLVSVNLVLGAVGFLVYLIA